jgi:hypothetical protein
MLLATLRLFRVRRGSREILVCRHRGEEELEQDDNGTLQDGRSSKNESWTCSASNESSGSMCVPSPPMRRTYSCKTESGSIGSSSPSSPWSLSSATSSGASSSEAGQVGRAAPRTSRAALCASQVLRCEELIAVLISLLTFARLRLFRVRRGSREILVCRHRGEEELEQDDNGTP